MRRLCFALGLVVSLVGGLLAGNVPVVAAEAGALALAEAAITTEVLKRHVDVLADDIYEGREAGSRGGRAAAGYLVQELTALGFEPGVNGKAFFQVFGADYRNVLAVLPGSDPKLREEVILVGAHFDHVGYGTQRNSFGPWGYIHNGADDNASGSSGLLGVATALAKLEPRPRRTVLLAFWDGEEKGLLGSKHWIRQPTVEPARIKLAINLDMIGRLRQGKVEVFGTRSAAGLRSLVAEANDQPDLRLDYPWEMKGNSDHYTFFERSLPTLMFHTGLHGDYHRPSDDAHKINAAGIEQVARLVFRVAVSAADAETLPGFRTAARSEGPRGQQTYEQPLPTTPPRLGLTTAPATEGAGLQVASVARGSAAERAGLKAGDRLLKFGGYTLPAAVPFTQLAWSAGGEVEVEVAAPAGEPRRLKVVLDNRPQRIGLAWRSNDAEPGVVAVVNVTPGAAGDIAGLKPGDRIMKAAGEPIADNDALLARLQTREPISLIVERAGQILPLTLTPVSVPKP